MFDQNKQANETAAASAQGIERNGTEESVQQESNNSSLSIQGPELSGSGLPVMQNRRGYCSCCHVHYNNLEQHVYSPQHRHFATYCRNRMGTTSLMERFLQDVLQHHPYRYHDNRPTYDDMPFASSQLPRDEALISLDLAEKGKTASQGEEPSTDSGFTAESACLISQRSHEELKNAFVSVAPIQRLESGQEHTIGTSPPKLNISCSTINLIPMENAVTETSNHKGPNITVSLFPHPLPVSHLSSTPYVLGKNTKYSVIPESVSSNQHEQNNHDICNQDRLPNPHLRSLLQPDRSRTIPFSRKSSACNQGYSIISGQLFCKEDGLQSQDETLISDFSLRNTSNLVGTSSSLTFQASSHLSDTKKSKISRGAETSVDEIIEEVILKYCHETAPKEFICGDEDTNSSVNILSLLDKSSLHGSDLSFDCDAAVQSRAHLPKASVKNLEPLKARQVTLQDDNYGLQLCSILRNDSVQQRSEIKKDKPVLDKEPVLPALPHVPPSFVGKTWSQIMHEDDMKIEALVRDFREGHFRCHFDTESLAHCARRRLRKQKMKEEERLHLVASKKTKATSAKGLPEFTDVSDFSLSSAISETQHIPEIQNVPETLKRPRKRTWRLASRCQVVKVSHGTQTSLVHYPVVKQKIIRRKSEPPDQKAGFLWPGNEQTPTMKTRLCALKLPESYTKIMSPVQPQTVVYVLSCPERKQFKSKAEDFPKIRRSHHSTDSKESVRYKYKQSCIKYYDPLTNRILKTPPKSLVGEKGRKSPHVRQLFRSLNLDANNKKQAGEQYDCVTPKSFSSTDLHSLSFKEKDMNSSHDTEASSLSLDRPECLVCNSSEKSYKHLVFSPLNSYQLPQEDDFSLIPFNKKQPSIPDCLGRDNPKTGWQRKKGSNRESGFPKKALAPAFGRHNLIKRGNKIQPHRTTVRQKEGRISTCSRKSCGLSAPSHQKMTAAVGKHLKKAKTDAKILKVARKPKRTFLNSAAIIGISEKRQRTTAKTSSRVKKWEATGEKSLLHTVE